MLDAKNAVEYREQLARLDTLYPGRETLKVSEAEEVTGVNRQTLLRDPTFPAKKLGEKRSRYGGVYIIPKSAFARWLITV